jgi:hypothetical protein
VTENCSPSSLTSALSSSGLGTYSNSGVMIHRGYSVDSAICEVAYMFPSLSVGLRIWGSWS